MSTLEKFNETLGEFESEVGKLKSVSTAYQKIEGLAAANAEVNRKFESARSELEKVGKLHVSYQEQLAQSLKGMSAAQQEGKRETLRLIEDQIEILRKANTVFHRDFEHTLRIKLDENKSEIMRLIEAERLLIKEIVAGELATRTREIRESLENESRRQTEAIMAGQKQIRMAVWVMGGLSVAIGLGVLAKLLVG